MSNDVSSRTHICECGVETPSCRSSRPYTKEQENDKLLVCLARVVGTPTESGETIMLLGSDEWNRIRELPCDSVCPNNTLLRTLNGKLYRLRGCRHNNATEIVE